jgi:hypothetical protein
MLVALVAAIGVSAGTGSATAADSSTADRP